MLLNIPVNSPRPVDCSMGVDKLPQNQDEIGLVLFGVGLTLAILCYRTLLEVG
jgi:hypothetical protein